MATDSSVWRTIRAPHPWTYDRPTLAGAVPRQWLARLETCGCVCDLRGSFYDDAVIYVVFHMPFFTHTPSDEATIMRLNGLHGQSYKHRLSI
jgi:hypothetical protein